MSDTSTNKFIGYGTNAERLAFTPSPATIAAAPHQAYIWYATDTDNVYAYTTAWHQISSSSSGGAISALTGDVTATGPGSVAATIANNAVTTSKIATTAVTLARIANASANDKLLGSGNSGSGASYAEITLGSGLTMTGTTLSAGGSGGTVTTTGSPASGNLTKFSGAASVTNADLTGDVTTSGGVATTIANSAVTLAKIANAAASSKLVGSGASGSGAAYSEITLGTNLSMSGTTLNAAAGSSGSLILLEQHTASSSATLPFTTSITSTYDEYMIEANHLIPATDSVELYLEVSTDGGSTWISSSSYRWNYTTQSTSTGPTAAGSASDVGIRLANAVNNTASWGVNGSWKMFDPLGSNFTAMIGQASARAASAYYSFAGHAGLYEATTAVNAFRVKFSSGNIASGTMRCYGIAK